MIIAIHGPNGSGKTTLAKKIGHNLRDSRMFNSIAIKSFADPLKDMVGALLGLPFSLLSGHDNREWREAANQVVQSHHWSDVNTPRDALIMFGEGMKRAFGENFWVDMLTCKLPEDIGERDDMVLIIDDLRFKPEFEWVKKNGGLVLYLTEPYKQDTISCQRVHDWQYNVAMNWIAERKND